MTAARKKPAARLRAVQRWTDFPQQVERRPLLLTIAEACGELRVCRVTLYKLLHERRLKSVKLGSRRMIPSASLVRLAEGSTA
jgi:excisionase family DNA binding protein